MEGEVTLEKVKEHLRQEIIAAQSEVDHQERLRPRVVPNERYHQGYLDGLTRALHFCEGIIGLIR